MGASRRRGRELQTAISAAVMTELRQRGYLGVTYDGVAARAATSKPVLYRRWPTRAEMVMAAVIDSTTEAIAAPDTGALAQDLEALLFAMRDNFGTSSRSAMLGLLAELDQHAAESLRTVIFRWGADLVTPMVARAQVRGELGPEQVPTPILALPLDLARHELAMRGVLPTDRIETIVGIIVVPLMNLHSRGPA